MRLSRILTLMMIALLPFVAAAQQDETPEDIYTQTVNVTGDVTFRIPEAWITLVSDGQTTIASSQATIDSVTETGPVPEGELFAVVFGGALSRVLDTVEPGPASIARGIAAQLGAGLEIQLAETDDFTVGEYAAARISWTFIDGQIPLDAGVIAVEINANFQVVFWYVTTRADFIEYTQVMQDIAATLDASTLEPEATPEPAPSDDLSAADLIQPFTIESRDLTLYLPEDWVAVEEDGQVYFGTSEGATASLTQNGGNLPVGGMSVIVLSGQIALGLEVPDTPEDVVTTLADQLLEATGTDAVSDVFSFMPDDDRTGAFQVWGYTLGSEAFSSGVMALRRAEETYIVFLFTIRGVDSAPYIAALQTVAAAATDTLPE